MMSGVIRASPVHRNELLFLPLPRTSHTKDCQPHLCRDVLSVLVNNQLDTLFSMYLLFHLSAHHQES